MAKISRVLRSIENNGLIFMCPGCNQRHSIYYGEGAGARWNWNKDAEKPTFSPSVLVRYDHWVPPAVPGLPSPEKQTMVSDICHSFVVDGKIQFLSDCTHQLAGKTVDLPDI